MIMDFVLNAGVSEVEVIKDDDAISAIKFKYQGGLYRLATSGMKKGEQGEIDETGKEDSRTRKGCGDSIPDNNGNGD